MGGYLFPIEMAVLTVLAIATTLVIPYIFYQYYKYGGVSTWRAMVLFSFFFYLLTAYYLVIFPLPDPKTMQASVDIWQYINLVPFKFIYDFMLDSLHAGVWFFKDPEFIGPFFNIVLMIPLGIYLSYYFKKDMKKTLLFTFLLSLFFEITQVSGLYGLYPHPYRVFDIDDLFLNTLGGFIGFGIYKNYLKFLPPKEKIDAKSLARSNKIGFTRRVFAFGADYLIILYPTTILMNIFKVEPNQVITLLIMYIYYLLCHRYFKTTLGKSLVRIRVVAADGIQDYLSGFLMRYGMLFTTLVVLSTLNLLVKTVDVNGVFAIIYIVIIFLLFVDFLYSFTKDKRLFYERLSKTYNINSLRSVKKVLTK